MERKVAGETKQVEDDQKWVYDSSVDHKGKVPLRASSGAWKASLFIIAIEFSERLSYFGIATTLIIYLTKVMHEDLKTAAKGVNYWAGVTTLMPLFGGFMADAYLGRFSTVFVATVIYLLGLSLLTMSRFVPGLSACDSQLCNEPRKIHEVVFFIAIYLISIGTGGHKPALRASEPTNSTTTTQKKGSRRCPISTDHVSWGVADIVLLLVLAVSLVIFIIGRPFYRYRKPQGSPLTPMLQVVLAAIKKRNLPYPSNPSHLYEISKSEKSHGRLLCHTKKLKFLDKAAIIEDTNNSFEKQSPWRLATVTKVEEMKLVLNMIPIWLASLPFGICVAQTTTFFIKQGITLNRNIGGGHFEIPPASIYSLAAIGMIISVTIYEKLLVPMLRRTTGNERGINILQRIGIGMLFSIATMAVAALVEKKRLRLVDADPVKGSQSMSIFWLAPQFIIIGVGDGFSIVGLQEYFYDQVPDSMRSLGIAFYLSVIGAANFLSSVLITIIDHATEHTTGKSWFGKDLNSSRLDKFYWLLAAMSAANLCLFVFLARRYSYKNVQNVAVADCYESDAKDIGGSMA
ncbi:hypothetical protein FNV43_RR09777 [Rhamnella rubrinervis]|uniref:Uncharacterized protein n=1 Tax=Rhamnella rubrinervis TaxID=2594499 RepID=A0A8K0HBY7_9ROSA|nr:hypothetical protein FNV43_RR09777 [Rhamnella rubrinervis]